jgi:3-dehydroquinate dehydratase-2
MAKKKSKNPLVIIINGPNLNMLGQREPTVYGTESLAIINRMLVEESKRLKLSVETFQSNSEGAIVDKIQQALGRAAGMIINPGAYTHTSIAIRDALLLLDLPIVEIHLSNTYRREDFRKLSMIADIVTGRIIGFGAFGYTMALQAIAQNLRLKP